MFAFFHRLAPVGRFFQGLWRVLDALRRHLWNTLLLLVLLALLTGWLFGGPPALKDKTVLVLELGAPLVEQRSGSNSGRAMRELQGEATSELRLRDLNAALEAAAKDPNIGSAVLLLDGFGGAGPALLREAAAAVTRFRASGKKVLAWAGHYDQRAYYLAAHADEVLLHPMGTLSIEGYARYRNYYKDAFDKLGLQANVIKVGSFKSFAEPYIANGPSKESLEAEGLVFNELWAAYTQGVEAARKLPGGSVQQLIDQLPQRLKDAGGNVAQVALQAKLVDGLKTRDEVRQLLVQRGASDDEGKNPRQVALGDYLQRQKPTTSGDAVGVVVAEGGIVDGSVPPGQVGGRSTGELIRKAREDKAIKAVVLRVNSPGGSAFGSELIRRELELTRAAGKPVVVSMGSVAASGGYWISMASDEVIADPTTITGSIGVVAMLPVARDGLDKLGVHSEGFGTTWLAGAYDPLRGLDPRLAEMVQASIGHVYAEFTGKAAAARKRTPEAIDQVGQGRVWTGAQAHQRGLVDRLGGYQDALNAAAKRAKLADGWRTVYLEREGGKLDQLLDLLGEGSVRSLAQAVFTREEREAAADQALAPLTAAGLPAQAARTLARELGADLGWLAEVATRRRPYDAVTHCLCAAP